MVLILTKPVDILRKPGKGNFFANRIQRKYPASANQLRLRAQHYNEGVVLAKALEVQGKALIVAPDDTCGVDTLTKDKKALRALYEKGYQDALRIQSFFT